MKPTDETLESYKEMCNIMTEEQMIRVIHYLCDGILNEWDEIKMNQKYK